MARPLTETETRSLRAFQRQVDRLRRSTLAQGKDVKLTYSQKIDNSSGQVETTFEGYEKDAFQRNCRSFASFFSRMISVLVGFTT